MVARLSPGIKPNLNYQTGSRDLRDRLTPSSYSKLYQIINREKKQGIGTIAIEELCQIIDQHGHRIVLSPGQRDIGHGTTSRSRLVRLHRMLGFIENKGRNKDFTFLEGVYREPGPNTGRGVPLWPISAATSVVSTAPPFSWRACSIPTVSP